MQSDRFRLRREFGRIKGLKPEERSPEVLQKFSEAVSASAKRLEDRKQRVPKLKYDTELPIYERKDEIAKAIIENQVVVISGETGSGKSTQLPLIALEAGFGISGLIGHTTRNLAELPHEACRRGSLPSWDPHKGQMSVSRFALTTKRLIARTLN